MKYIGCTVKKLPDHLHLAAAETACRVNPANAPLRAHGLVLPPEHIALLTNRYWGAKGVSLSVQFLDLGSIRARDVQLKAKVLAHMNAWGSRANVRFYEATAGIGQVRIARGNTGYWSYLGTDVLHIAAGEPTLNLQGFTLDTPDSEFYRVVRHETGHTLAFPHEHERAEIIALLDASKVIASFTASQGWSRQEVINQILTPLPADDIQATPADVRSIMCYGFDGSVTLSGQPIPGGTDINEQDYQLAAKAYPPAGPVGPPPVPPVSPPPPVTPPAGQLVIDLAAKVVRLAAGWTAK